MTLSKCRYRRAEASQYLLERHGIERAPATLAKLAVIGGGPEFVKAGRFPLYTPEALDVWAASIMSRPVRSTAELGRPMTQLQNINSPGAPIAGIETRVGLAAERASRNNAVSPMSAEQPLPNSASTSTSHS